MSQALHPMLNIAVKAARSAGTIINRASLDLDLLKVNTKSPNDFVTEVDHKAEAAIIETLLGAYPGHGILAEESGRAHGAKHSEYVWIIDPLDGTTNFIHGFPVYAVSIALAFRGQIQQAVVYDPTRNDLFYASKGRGAFLNDRRLRVSKRTRLQDCLVSTGFPFRKGDNFKRYLQMMETLMPACAGLRRPGAAALDLCHVAAGYTDGFFENGLSPWDMAAGALMVTEAGGLIGNFTGDADFLYQRECLAGNPRVYAQLVTLLSPYTNVIAAAPAEPAAPSAAPAAAAGPTPESALAQALGITDPAASPAAPKPRKPATRIRKGDARRADAAGMALSALEAVPSLRHSRWLRLLLGLRILNGLAVGVGLGVLSVLVYWLGGATIAGPASVGMLVLSIGDQPAPARGKLRQMAPLLWLAAPLTLAVQLAQSLPLHDDAAVGALVCIGGFVGMLGTAWGVRGAPLGFALLLAIVFAMATPPPPEVATVLLHTAWFEVGALLYTAYAVLAARVLNLRFRTQALAEALNDLAAMLREQGARVATTGDRHQSHLRALLVEQAALADRLQTARDLVLDLPASAAEQRLAGMLIAAIRLREQALACELELDAQARRGSAPVTLAQAQALEGLWQHFGAVLDRVCWSLYTGGALPADLAQTVRAQRADALAAAPAALRDAAQAMADELHSLLRLAARSGDEPRLMLAEQARDWPRFRTSMRWPLAPLKRAMTGRSPVLRYALRVALALGVGYAIALHLPWATHPHWILLTIAVVMRTNLAQTLERRNARLLGTLAGCVLVTALLSLHPSVPLQFALLAFAAGIAHGFAQVRYLVAATAATVLALLQGHLLHTAGEFALVERLADTLIGTAIAWAFSYVLPAWERRQLPALLGRVRQAQLAHARIALGDADLATANADWRLARREIHDSLAAIALAAQRALAEPRAVQPPLDLLERVQLRSYRLLALLGGVRTWREQPRALPADAARPLLDAHLARISAALAGQDSAESVLAPVPARTETITSHEETARLHARLDDAADEAAALAAALAAAEAWDAARRPAQ